MSRKVLLLHIDLNKFQDMTLSFGTAEDLRKLFREDARKRRNERKPTNLLSISSGHHRDLRCLLISGSRSSPYVTF